MILGVTDRRPRRVVGSRAFATDLERTKAGLVERLRLRIAATELAHADGRVLVFEVPSRPIGMPIQYEGAYWMRAGEDLVPMTPDQLRRIFDEAGPDFSAEICPRATLADLDPAAIARLRALWRRKSGNVALDSLGDEQLLVDTELVIDGGVTYAALILPGTRRGLGRHLARAEGKGRRYLLSRRFYEYTRRRGLDRATHKVLPELERTAVQNLVRALKAEGLVHSTGRTRGALWYPGSKPEILRQQAASTGAIRNSLRDSDGDILVRTPQSARCVLPIACL